MKMHIKKLITIIFAAVLFMCFSVTVNAALELPEGTVAGLPEKLVVLDDEGHSVNDSGEYFFQVDSMKAGITYNKKIQIMNMRQDKAYEILFRAEPMINVGEIDLENNCRCVITLDGKTVYQGKVSGKGDPDITVRGVSLGKFSPGESRILECSITWDDVNAGNHIDNGVKIYSADGTVVEKEKNGDEYISGMTTFKWIFFAEVSETDKPTVDTGSMIAYSGIVSVMLCAVVVMMILVKKKKSIKEESDI